jgi:hypothetical protein
MLTTTLRFLAAVFFLRYIALVTARGKGMPEIAIDSPSHPIPVPWVYPIDYVYVGDKEAEPFIRYQGPPIPIIRGKLSPKMVQLVEESNKIALSQKVALAAQEAELRAAGEIAPEQIHMISPPVVVPPNVSTIIPIIKEDVQQPVNSSDIISQLQEKLRKSPASSMKKSPVHP